MNHPVPHDNHPPPWLEKGYAALLALLPWSVDVDFGAWNLTAPSEPLVAVVGLALVWVALRQPARLWQLFSTGIVLPLSLLWIVWMAVAAGFSTMLPVSLKYWLVEAGQWWVFAVGMALWPGMWLRVLPFFLWSMLGVGVYTVVHHAMFHFRADQALLAPMPFFPDHTLYAAVLAMLVFYVPMTPKEGLGNSAGIRVQWAMALVFTLALVISTCRAAVISLGVAGAVYAAWYWRKRPVMTLFGGLLLLFMGYAYLSHKAQGTADVSYRERLNRWDCAASMLQARPWTGFGPGTFPFQYLPFQRSEKMTRISVQQVLTERGPHTYGRGGGAHSEYWQAAAELGWPGAVLWVGLVFGSLWAGGRQALRSSTPGARRLALFATLGLVTFFVHVLANNFLHDGRIAALVWGGMAWLSQPPRDSNA